MDYRHPEPVVVGDFVKTVLDEGPYRLETIATPMYVDVTIAFVRDSRGQRRWFPRHVLRRVTLTTDEEAQWTIDLLSR